MTRTATLALTSLACAATLALTSCHDPDPACVDALDRETAMEQTLARMHSELGDLRSAAVELQSRSSPIKECAQVPAASTTAASAQCDADLTRALVRADTAERDLKELKAKVRDASRAWKDPSTSYDSAFEMMQRLDQ